jgi:predicted O-methyltransferase YrrM
LSWPGTIVEIGSYLGNSTIYLALGGNDVHAVDPHTPKSMIQLPGMAGEAEAGIRGVEPGDPSQSFLSNLERFGVRDRVSYHRAHSSDVARTWSGEAVRLLYVDGMHTYAAVSEDYEAWRPFLADRHVVLFDDYLWPAVEHAVNDLRKETCSRHFYVRGGQAILSTEPLSLRVIGLP